MNFKNVDSQYFLIVLISENCVEKKKVTNIVQHTRVDANFRLSNFAYCARVTISLMLKKLFMQTFS